MQHYDSTGCVGAFVRAHDGNLGIWLSGAVRSDAPAERIRDMRANPPSLDYRWENGRELVAVLSVPVGGFPIPRYEAHVVASGGDEEVQTLILTGYVPADAFRSRKRKKKMLSERVYAALGQKEKEMATRAEMRQAALEWPYLDTFRTYTAEQRRRYAKSGIAMEDGSFPIPDCGAAEDAIRSQGRGQTPQSQRAVVRHIRKRVSALGCSGDIFDNYK